MNTGQRERKKPLGQRKSSAWGIEEGGDFFEEARLGVEDTGFRQSHQGHGHSTVGHEVHTELRPLAIS